MLPSLALLDTTCPPAKRGTSPLDRLPQDILERIVLKACGGLGVPLMMVIKETRKQGILGEEEYSYLRLPDPNELDPAMNVTFENDFAFPELLDAIVDFAGYTKNSKHPIFVELDDQQQLPLGNPDVDNYMCEMVEFLDHATRFDANGRPKRSSSFWTSVDHLELLFSSPPLFNSHIAIILRMQLNE